MSLRALAAAGACGLLVACAAPAPTPPAGPAAEPPQDADAWVADFERRLRERADAAARQGRLADAADAWELLTLVRPAEAGYAERLAATRREIEAAAAPHRERARQAGKRGELDAAVAQWLAVLALDPRDAQAADALRAIERERDRRGALARPTRKPGIDAPAAAGTPTP
jgi:hypothetical protein